MLPVIRKAIQQQAKKIIDAIDGSEPMTATTDALDYTSIQYRNGTSLRVSPAGAVVGLNDEVVTPFVRGSELPPVIGESIAAWVKRGRSARDDGGFTAAFEACGLARENQGTDSPAMRQYRRFKAKHADCILLFEQEFGGYVCLEADAFKVNATLGFGLSNNLGVPTVLVPEGKLESSLRMLIAAGNRCAVCQKVSDK